MQTDGSGSIPGDLLLQSYDFSLPDGQIARFPPEKRGDSRLMYLERNGKSGPAHKQFADLPELLPAGALLVANNSSVVPARLEGLRPSGGKVEFLLLTPLPLLLRAATCSGGIFIAEAECLLKAGGRIKPGDEMELAGGIGLTVLARADFGRHTVRLAWQGDLAGIMARHGQIPLPPYLGRKATSEDSVRYQTIYADSNLNGSVAAPTAGLHFSQSMLDRLAGNGFELEYVSLHVGYGTFSPVRESDIRKHVMHKEYLEVPEKTALAIAKAMAEARPVVCVGTTSLRAIEGMALACGSIRAWQGWTDIFCYPGYQFRIADGLLTNFHLPQSSLIILVAAFAGRERVLEAYREAVNSGYRFFSYGDAMLIV